MGEKNKYGLGRYIESDTRRLIRKRCGFGCVICGIGFFDYEHFDPDFAEAKEHNPEGMTLLCMQCNQKRRRGTLSASTVKRYNEFPKALSKGFANEWLDVGVDDVEVVFAGSSFIDCKTLINVRGDAIFSVLPPEEAGSPFRLSGFFADDTGAITLKIEENQWIAGADNWDVEWVGKTVTIRKGHGDIVLVMTTIPPNKLIVEKLNMLINGVHLVGSKDTLKVSFDGINYSSFTTCSMRSCGTGILIN